MADATTRPLRPLFEPGTANPYLPMPATVVEVVTETHNIKTFRVVLQDEEAMKGFRFEPGQAGQLSVFGVGESTFVINSPPTRMDYLPSASYTHLLAY